MHLVRVVVGIVLGGLADVPMRLRGMLLELAT